MGDRRRARTYVSLAVVALVHAGLFLLLSRALAPAPTPTAPEVVIAPVYLARLEPRRPPAAADRPRPAPRRARIGPRPAPREVAALPTPAPVAQPAPTAAPAPQPDAERARLAATLRAGAGCATPHLLTPKERGRCERQLADGAREARYIPVPLPPERRAYYDALAKAKSHERRSLPVIAGETRVPDPSAGARGSLAALQLSNEEIRIPLVGCKVSFGGKGAGVVKPPNSLRLGKLPCFISPPEGSLTVGASIQNPDKVLKNNKKD